MRTPWYVAAAGFALAAAGTATQLGRGPGAWAACGLCALMAVVTGVFARLDRDEAP